MDASKSIRKYCRQGQGKNNHGKTLVKPFVENGSIGDERLWELVGLVGQTVGVCWSGQGYSEFLWELVGVGLMNIALHPSNSRSEGTCPGGLVRRDCGSGRDW